MIPRAVVFHGGSGECTVLDLGAYRAFRDGTLFVPSFRLEPDPLMPNIPGKRHWLGSDPHPLLGIRSALCGTLPAGGARFTRDPARITCERCLAALRAAVLGGATTLPADDARRVLRRTARITQRKAQAKQATKRARAEKVARLLASRGTDAILI